MTNFYEFIVHVRNIFFKNIIDEDKSSGKLFVEEFQNARLGKGSLTTGYLGLFPRLGADSGRLKSNRNS